MRPARLSREFLHKPGFTVTVLDTQTDTTQIYQSLRRATKVLKCTRATLQKYNKLLFQSRYMITVNTRVGI